MNRTSELNQIGDDGTFLFIYIFQQIHKERMIKIKISLLRTEFCPPEIHALKP